MATCRTSRTEAACTSSSSVCIRSLGPWHLSGLAVGRWLVWAPCSSSDNTSTPTTAVCVPAVAAVPTPQRPSSSSISLFFLSSADSFETMLKSLLGYQSGTGGGPTDSVIRKKVYQSAIDITLKNNFPLVLKVCVMVEKKETSVGFLKLCLLTFLVFISWWQSWWQSGSHTQRPSTPLCVPTSWSWPWRPSPSWPWARAALTTPGSFHSARTTTRWVFLVSLTS